MNIDSVGSASAMKTELANGAAASLGSSFQDALANVDSGSSESEVVSVLLEVIMMLMELLNGEEDAETPESGGLAESLSGLAEAVSALAEAINGSEGEEAAPTIDPRDMNEDGVVTVFEVAESFSNNLAEIQSQAKSPLDYLAGGRDINNLI